MSWFVFLFICCPHYYDSCRAVWAKRATLRMSLLFITAFFFLFWCRIQFLRFHSFHSYTFNVLHIRMRMRVRVCWCVTVLKSHWILLHLFFVVARLALFLRYGVMFDVLISVCVCLFFCCVFHVREMELHTHTTRHRVRMTFPCRCHRKNKNRKM